MEEDGFHSISWDDAPPRSGFADMSGVGGDEDDDGFDKISPSSPPDEHGFGAASSSTLRPESESGRRIAFEPGDYEWDGRWMTIDVKDPVKEHEGSKDMFVSYAVQTRVRCDAVRELTAQDQSQDVQGVAHDCSAPVPGFFVPPRPPPQELPGVCHSAHS